LSLGRFRNWLVEHDLWERLLGEINSQLEARNIILTQGRISIIDATPIEAVQFGSGKGKGYRNKPLSAKDRRRNDTIAVIHAGGERSFAKYKSG
jgi:IS5 family transposase|tara:strand:+ start:99 stop:380 length:282 start_codon:yes stop_codon:yes gene_type:complete